jgi:hypothetical protein
LLLQRKLLNKAGFGCFVRSKVTGPSNDKKNIVYNLLLFATTKRKKRIKLRSVLFFVQLKQQLITIHNMNTNKKNFFSLFDNDF